MTKSRKGLSVGFLFDDTLDSTDGVAQYVKILGAWYKSQGHKVTYLVGQSSLSEWEGGRVVSLSKNIKVVFNGNRLSMPIYSSSQRIKRALEDAQLDVLHVQVPYSPLMAAKVIKRAHKNTVVIGTFHIYPSGFLSRHGSRLLKIWLSRNLKHFDKMLSVSSAAQEFAKSGYGLESEIIPNTLELAKFKTSVQPKLNTIVFLGRLVGRKGCLELIKAFAKLKKELPDAQLIVGGKGPDQSKLQRYVDTKKIEGVSFKGFIPEANKAEFLAQGSVACFPSLNGECFGLVLVEAMAAGSTVVLGGDNPGYRSVLGEQEKLLINPKDTEDFAVRLKELLSNKKIASELNQWQQESVKQYDVNIVGSKLVKLYRSLIDIKTKNGHNDA